MQAVAELGYRPNAAARFLAERRRHAARPHAVAAAIGLFQIHLKHHLEHFLFTELALFLAERGHIHDDRATGEFRARLKVGIGICDFHIV